MYIFILQTFYFTKINKYLINIIKTVFLLVENVKVKEQNILDT